MADKSKLIGFSKRSNGDIILEINPDKLTIKSLVRGILSILLIITLPIFSFFDFLASKKKLVISSVGLGIGLGLSVVVTQQPDALQAFPQFANNINFKIRASRIIVPSINLSAPVSSGNVQNLVQNIKLSHLIHDNRSADLGNLTPVVIADVGIQNILENLEHLKIGDEIQIIGTNKALYRYKAIEIRNMKAEYLPNVIGSQDESLIIYKSTNFLRTQLYIVIAKPIK